MTTETQQKGSGQPSSDRITPRLRPAPPAEAAAPERMPVTPAAQMRRMAHSDFNTAMNNFHRAKLQLSNSWRNRLDTTSCWALLIAGATLSFVFGSSTITHFVIPINSILVAIFLIMEARRDRYYEI